MPHTKQPLTSSTANPAAATAALSAFSRRGSSPSLSEAAAAAALKARPHTLTNVAEVQTKRTIRRSASVASSNATGGTGNGSPRPPLRRPGSAGSMTERSFRSPSPHRPSTGSAATSGHRYTQSYDGHEDAPPVPSIPANVQAQPQPRQHQRASSLGIKTAPVRTASQRLKEGKATWFGAPALGEPSNIRTSDAPMAAAAAAQPQEPRPDSRTSINFSYPARLRLGSPSASPVLQETEREPGFEQQSEKQQRHQKAQHAAPPQSEARRASTTMSPQPRAAPSRQRAASTASDQELVYDPNSRRMVPRAELVALDHIIQVPAESKPAPKKKKPSRAGSHLARGSVSRTKGAEMQNQRSAKAAPASPPAPAPVRPRVSAVLSGDLELQEPAVKTNLTMPRNDDQSDRAHANSGHDHQTQPLWSPSHYLPEVVDSVEPYSPPPPGSHSAGYVLSQRPSIVQEEKEEIEMEAGDYAQPSSSHATSDALDSVIMREYVYEQPAVEIAPQTHREHATVQARKTSASPAELSADTPEVEPAAKFDQQKKASAIRPPERSHSNSPARVAHFGPVQRNLSVRYSPPPRSISPRKSAMKQHSPPRSNSSADEASEASAALNGREDAPLPRKKSVRVSFDNRDIVVEGPASPPSPPQARTDSPTATTGPPQSRRPWYSNIGLSKKKKDSSAALDDDEIMKPRPALPSFGSVRERKPPRQQEEERPLVRPTEASYSPSLPDSPSLQSIPAVIDEQSTGAETGAETGTVVGLSSDQAVGAILAQDYSSRIPANTSRFREPLPPVVTSREGMGYNLSSSSSSSSDSDGDDSESDRELLADTPVLSTEHSVATTVPDVDAEEKPLNGFTIVALPEPTQTSPPPTLEDTSETQPNEIVHQASPFAQHSEPMPDSIPAISISEPSPLPSEEKQLSSKALFVPGGFPEDESDASTAPEEVAQPSSCAPSETVPATSEIRSAPMARQVTFEPVRQKPDAGQDLQTPATVAATRLPIIGDDSDSEGSSIYSDAYEDLDEVDDYGFQSLDAVLESPMGTSMSNKSPFGSSTSTPQRSPAAASSPRPAITPTAASAASTKATAEATPVPATETHSVTAIAPGPSPGGPSEPQDDWEAAKAYWRGLTAEKRAQLEREAIEEAGADADLDQAGRVVEAAGGKKPRRKKSVEKRAAEKKAMQDALQQQQQQHHHQIQQHLHPERVYMIKPGTKVADEVAEASSGSRMLKRSMRGDPQPHGAAASSSSPAVEVGRPLLRKSMRGAEALQPSWEQQQQHRQAAPGQQARVARTAGAPAPAPAAAATVARPLSYPPPAAAVGAASNRDSKASTAKAKTAGHSRAVSSPNVSAAATSPPAASTQRAASGGGGGMTSFFPPALRRRGSTSSESSFKRSRHPGGDGDGGGGGGFGFRKTLRASPASSLEHGREDRSRRFSLRSFSPSDSVRHGGAPSSPPPVSMHSPRMRVSMRDGAHGGDGKASKGGGGGLHMPSFGLKSKSKFKAKGKGKGYKSSGSRFDDSSDEDGGVGGGGGFRSRFEDSSDEDEIVPLPRSVVPITAAAAMKATMRATATAPANKMKTKKKESLPPKRHEEEEDEVDPSLEHPGSSNDEGAAARPGQARIASSGGGAAFGAPHRSRSGRGMLGSPQALGTSTMKGVGTGAGPTPVSLAERPARRTSFILSVLGRKKTDGGGIQRGELMESAARRDTALERSKSELAVMRAGGAGGRPVSPRLQKRTASLPLMPTRSSLGGGDWPLMAAVSPTLAEEDDDDDDDNDDEKDGGRVNAAAEKKARQRPASAGNLLAGGSATATSVSSSRPGFTQRRSLSYGDAVAAVGAGGGDGEGEGGGKPRKKKFAALRRMFRLDD